MSDRDPFSQPLSSPPRHRRRAARGGWRLTGRGLRARHVTGVVVVAGGVVFGAGAALAAFTTTGSGTASISLPDPSIQVTAPPSGATGLHPGATAPAEVVVVNDGPAPFRVTSIRGTATATEDGCPGDVIRLVPPTPMPSMSASATTTVTVGVAMATDASAACQDTSFGLTVTVDGSIG